jgi:hypothetical protein
VDALGCNHHRSGADVRTSYHCGSSFPTERGGGGGGASERCVTEPPSLPGEIDISPFRHTGV